MIRFQMLVCVSSCGSHVTLSPSVCESSTQIQTQLAASLILQGRSLRTISGRDASATESSIALLVPMSMKSHAAATSAWYLALWCLNLRNFVSSSQKRRTAKTTTISADAGMALGTPIDRLTTLKSRRVQGVQDNNKRNPAAARTMLGRG